MAKPAKGSRVPSYTQLSYQLLRNVTSPDESATGVRAFVINLPALEILKLNTKENLRSYLAEYNPRKRNQVHNAIENTIQSEPQRFITRNSGFVIAGSEVDIDDNKKLIKVFDASIINGAQSQGEIRRWVEALAEGDEGDLRNEPPFYVRAEVIIDPDDDELVETAIARNTATPVKSISQAGARGHLDDLEKSIQAAMPGTRVRKSETDDDSVLDTRRVLQLARLLMPASVSLNDAPAEKLRPYKNPEQCLTEFSQWFEDRKNDPDAKAKYDFTVQIAPQALQEYAYWERHHDWHGQRIWEETKKGGRACRRDPDTGKVAWVSPGLIFPILGAMSEFVVNVKGRWMLKKPSLFKPSEMISRAVNQFRALSSDPMQMGRSAGAYDAVRIYPRTIVEVMRDIETARP